MTIEVVARATKVTVALRRAVQMAPSHTPMLPLVVKVVAILAAALAVAATAVVDICKSGHD
jgi:hypothetical protein